MKRLGKLTGFLLSALFVILVATAVPSHSQKGGRSANGLGSGSSRDSDMRDLFGNADDLSDDLDGSGSRPGRRTRVRIHYRATGGVQTTVRSRMLSYNDPGYSYSRKAAVKVGPRKTWNGNSRHR